MIHLKPNYQNNKYSKKKVLIVMTIIGLTTFIPSITDHMIFVVHAEDDTTTWIIRLRITEKSGSSNTVVFGQKLDASDGLDSYDLPAPPAPPQLPFIQAWFDTSFEIPFNNLLQEYKYSSSNQTVWNLSLIWVAAPGNLSNATLTILWDSPFRNTNVTHSLLLFENDVIIANMITEDSYSFLTNGSLHSFQIIYQRETSNTIGEPREPPILPFAIAGVLCIIFITVAIVFLKRKKN